LARTPVTRWLGRFQSTQAIQALAPQDAADAGPRDSRKTGDAIHGPALAPQGDHLALDPLRGSPRLAPRPGRTIHKTRTAGLLEPLDPALHGLRIHAKGAGRGPKASAVIQDPTGHLLSTAGTH